MRIAVTGASGILGRQVVELLGANEGNHVVALTRRKLRYGRQLPNLSTAVADYTDLAALRTALCDVDTLVFVTSDGAAEHVLRHHHNVVQAAVDVGVGHIVALGSLDADLTSPFCYAVIHGHTEQLLYDSGCAISIARASIYTEFFMGWLTRAATTGQLRLPAADGRISLVSRTDVGRCLAALAVAAPTGRHHDITGPESLDLATIAALTERAWGTPIRYVNLTQTEYHIDMARAGEKAWWIYAFSTMFDSVREQRWDSTSTEVSLLTGHPPTPLPSVLAQHRAARQHGRR